MLDAYSRRARLTPAALAALPALALMGGSLVALDEAGSVLAFALGGVGTIICGLVRNAGLGLQPTLWDGWGGAPTTQRLRWNGNDQGTVGRRHRRLEALTDEILPAADEEEQDPPAADLRYEDATAQLRELTRDRSEFPLVAEENAEYGFRRNCLGLRPVAVSLAAIVLVVCTVLIASGHSTLRYWIPALISVAALLAWWRIITPAWVRQAAELYADRLFEAMARLNR